MDLHNLTIKALFLTVLWLICCTKSHGQVLQNIFNGYLITQQNDTLRGEIDVVSPNQAQSPSLVGFRKKTDYTFKRYYLASELKTVVLYSVTTKDTLIFYAKKISINFSERLVKQFNPNLPNIRQDTTLFLRALTLGKANLYYFEDDALRPYFFIEKQGQPITVLIDETKNVTDNAHTPNLDFRNQLYQSLNDCRSFDKSTFNRLNFSAVDLIKLTKTYNAKFPSTNKNFVVEITQNKRVFGLMLGVHKTNVRQYSWTHEASNVTPSVGAWMAFDIHPKVPFQLNVELEYAPFKTNAFRQRSIIVYKYADSLSFQSNYVRANALFKYAYRVDKKASIYAKFGASFATSVKNTVRQVAASYDELLLKGTIFITKPKIRTVDLGFITALGVQYDRAAVEFRYRLSNGYSSAEMVRTSVDDVSLTAFWDFAPNKIKIKSQIRQ